MMVVAAPGPYSRIMLTARLSSLAAPRRVDLLVAAGLLGWALPDVPWWWRPPGHGAATPVVLGYLALALAQSIPFVWRRSFPVAVLGLAGAVLLARVALGDDPTSAFAAALVGAYGLGAYGDQSRRYARWLGGAALLAAAALALEGNGIGNRARGLPYALLGAAFVVGDATSARRSETVAAVEAAHLAERARIARELHDVLAHQLSAIAVRSGAARLAATTAIAGASHATAAAATAPAETIAITARAADPRSVEALAAIEQLSREALGELSHLLGALRREPDDDPARRPAPTLGALDALLATTRAAGVPVDLEVDGRVRPLSPRGRAGGLPHHPGGPDERRQARASRAGARRPALPRRPTRPRGRQRSVGGRQPTRGRPRRARGRRHARARRPLQRPPRGRRHARRRVRGHRRDPLLRRRSRRRRGRAVTATEQVSVLVADDQAVVRAGLAMLLDSQPGLAVVGQAANGLEAVRLARELEPDVVLMDIRMPVLDGLEATRRILGGDAKTAAGRGPLRVVVLTTYDLDEYVYDALRAGACGFLLKHAPPEELVFGVRAAADGGALLSPSVTSRLLEEFATRRPATTREPPALGRLTAREREVLDLVIRGRSNTEIARALVIAETTVKTHVAHAMDKLGLRDRVHAVVYAYEHGLVTPGTTNRL
jgi:DNA-binding NarL/FixJ family response regulator